MTLLLTRDCPGNAIKQSVIIAPIGVFGACRACDAG